MRPQSASESITDAICRDGELLATDDQAHTKAYQSLAMACQHARSMSLGDVSRCRRRWNGAIACAVMVLPLVSMLACDRRTPLDIQIPSGYVGWVEIRFLLDAPPLEKRDGYYVVRVPESGLATTSSRMETGWGHDRFSYLDESGTLEVIPAGGPDEENMIWAGQYEQSATGEELTSYKFFVGSREQYLAHVEETANQASSGWRAPRPGRVAPRP